jgi:uncharacterized protein YeaO (DUF488 family)
MGGGADAKDNMETLRTDVAIIGGGPRNGRHEETRRVPVIRIKRAYEAPGRGDGRRILVERLWPRGLTKAALAADAWLKDVAPSTELRAWFGHRPERWKEFRKRYRRELGANSRAWQPILDAGKRGAVTLLYGARDTVRNSAVVLRQYVIEHAQSESRPAARRSRSMFAKARAPSK